RPDGAPDRPRHREQLEIAEVAIPRPRLDREDGLADECHDLRVVEASVDRLVGVAGILVGQQTRAEPAAADEPAEPAGREKPGGGAQELAPAAPEVEDGSTRQVAREPEDARDERRPEAATAGEPLVALPNLRVRELVPGLQHAGDPVASAASERPTIRPSRYRIRYAPRST